MAQSILRKPIPRSGELLPVVGLGTWQTFDVGAASTERASLKEVLREFVQRGGSVIDSSPMYGRSETVGGDLAAELGIHKQLFVATKVWTSGREAGIRQMEESFRRLARAETRPHAGAQSTRLPHASDDAANVGETRARLITSA